MGSNREDQIPALELRQDPTRTPRALLLHREQLRSAIPVLRRRAGRYLA